VWGLAAALGIAAVLAVSSAACAVLRALDRLTAAVLIDAGLRLAVESRR